MILSVQSRVAVMILFRSQQFLQLDLTCGEGADQLWYIYVLAPNSLSTPLNRHLLHLLD